MPARSRSQQRLFGMVHAFNKGEFSGSRSLRRRVASLAGRISATDAEHFAKTPHDGLPEKKAGQEYMNPNTVMAIAGRIPYGEYAESAFSTRSERRRSLLERALSGAAIGAAAGGIGVGAAGAFLSHRATEGLPVLGRLAKMQHAAARTGIWGAQRGAVAGGLAGLGLGVLERIRG